MSLSDRKVVEVSRRLTRRQVIQLGSIAILSSGFTSLASAPAQAAVRQPGKPEIRAEVIPSRTGKDVAGLRATASMSAKGAIISREHRF